jgi:hypothetical protein
MVWISSPLRQQLSNSLTTIKTRPWLLQNYLGQHNGKPPPDLGGTLKGKYDMATKQSQIVSIDDTEYDAANFNEQQIALFNHCVDLDRKIGATQFQLHQLVVGKDAFLKLLKDALKDQPAEAKEAQ